MPATGSTVTYSQLEMKSGVAPPAVTVSVMVGAVAKTTVVAFRAEHYKELIDEFGLADWDGNDERSTHMNVVNLCEGCL